MQIELDISAWLRVAFKRARLMYIKYSICDGNGPNIRVTEVPSVSSLQAPLLPPDQEWHKRRTVSNAALRVFMQSLYRAGLLYNGGAWLQVAVPSECCCGVSVVRSAVWVSPPSQRGNWLRTWQLPRESLILCSRSPAAEMGDRNPSQLPGYTSKCHFIPEQDEDFLSGVEDLHPQHK